MADAKISALTALAGSAVAADDVLAIVDTSATTTTKNITIEELMTGLFGGTCTFDTTFSLASAATFGWSTDLILRRAGAANLALGAANAASPVAQTISVQSVLAGTSDVAGATTTFIGSISTGTGLGGGFDFRSSSKASSTASTANTVYSLMSIAPYNVAGVNRTMITLPNYSNVELGSAGNLIWWQGGNVTQIMGGDQGTVYTRDAVISFTQSNVDANAAKDTGIGRSSAGIIEINNGTKGTYLDLKLRNLIPGASLSTSMTDGFMNMAGAAGAPSGAPSVTTGFPFYYDSTNNKIYVYNGSWRSTAALT